MRILIYRHGSFSVLSSRNRCFSACTAAASNIEIQIFVLPPVRRKFVPDVLLRLVGGKMIGGMRKRNPCHRSPILPCIYHLRYPRLLLTLFPGFRWPLRRKGSSNRPPRGAPRSETGCGGGPAGSGGAAAAAVGRRGKGWWRKRWSSPSGLSCRGTRRWMP